MAVYQIAPNGNWCASIPGINWEFRTLQEQIDALAGGGSGSAGNIYVPFEYPGVLTDETSFGYWVAPAACEVLGTIMYAGEVATGNNVTIDYVKNGSEQGQISTLNAGAEFQATTFAPSISLTLGDALRAKTKTIGSATTEGAFLTALAIIRYT